MPASDRPPIAAPVPDQEENLPDAPPVPAGIKISRFFKTRLLQFYLTVVGGILASSAWMLYALPWMRSARGFFLLRASERLGQPYYDQAHEILASCRPGLFFGPHLPLSVLEAIVRCLAAFQEKDKILELTRQILQTSSTPPSTGVALVMGSACLGIGAETEAAALFAHLRNASGPERHLAGVFKVRTLFPNHWGRHDPKGRISFPRPQILGLPDRRWVELPLPYDDCVEVNDVRVVTPSFSIFDRDDSMLIYDLASHPRHPYIAGYYETMRGSHLAMDRAVGAFPYSCEDHLPAAIHLAGRSAVNYFHWIAEYLPRLLNVIESRIDSSAPLLVPAGLPASMMRALDIVNAGRFPIQICGGGTLLTVDRLFVPSMVSCVVDGRALPFPKISALSPRHLNFVRDSILDAVEGVATTTPLPEKIYLLRGKRTRAVHAEETLREILLARGFVAMDPCGLSFEDQVRMFRDAKAIVGASGAAFANLLFCRNQPAVLAFIAEHNVDFTLFANLLHIAGGGRFSQIPGKTMTSPMAAVNEDQFVHVDFDVTPADVLTTLDRMGL